MPEFEQKEKNGIFHQLRQFVDLKTEYVKLTAAEKVSVLLSTVAFAVIIGVIAFVSLFFVTVAGAHWIGQAIGMSLSYTIFAAFYILLLVLVFIFKRQLIVDPVTRFITKLFLH